MIKSIFFARFDPEKGPLVLHQTPPHSIATGEQASPSLHPGSAPPSPLPVPSALPLPLSPTSTHVRSPSPLGHALSLSPPLSPAPAPTLPPAPASVSALPPPRLARKPLLDFAAIAFAVIPHQTLCNAPLSVCAAGQRVLGHPVCIAHERYPRNEFIFNFCVVLDETADFTAHVKVVRAVARLLRGLEEEAGWLSEDEQGEDGGAEGTSGDQQSASMSGFTTGGEDSTRERRSKVRMLCEMLMEDLNSYCEVMVGLDDKSVLNHRLHPVLPPPPHVQPWHVPVPTTRLTDLVDSNWDITMLALLPHIDGLTTVAKLAALAGSRIRPASAASLPPPDDDDDNDNDEADEVAGVDTDLAALAVSDLVYFGCATLLPPPTFSAVYAPTPGVRDLVRNEPRGVAAECSAFVSVRAAGPLLAHLELVELYCSLRPGLPLKQWYLDGLAGPHASLFGRLDAQRFVVFGLVRGWMWRAEKVVALPGGLSEAATPVGVQSPPPAGKRGAEALPLQRFLNGLHSVDQMCVELGIGESELMGKIRAWDGAVVVSR